MNRRTIRIALAAVAIAIAAFVTVPAVLEVIGESPPHRASSPILTQVPVFSARDDETLQFMAQKACQCSAAGGGSACWTKFEAATANQGRGIVDSASAPVSTSLSCVAGEDGEMSHCVTLEHTVLVANAAGTNQILCTTADVDAVEKAYQAAFKQAGGQDESNLARANAAAQKAVLEALQRINARNSRVSGH
jgi:hypothetical protein